LRAQIASRIRKQPPSPERDPDGAPLLEQVGQGAQERGARYLIVIQVEDPIGRALVLEPSEEPRWGALEVERETTVREADALIEYSDIPAAVDREHDLVDVWSNQLQ
jgi:hypothetical protein